MWFLYYYLLLNFGYDVWYNSLKILGSVIVFDDRVCYENSAHLCFEQPYRSVTYYSVTYFWYECLCCSLFWKSGVWKNEKPEKARLLGSVHQCSLSCVCLYFYSVCGIRERREVFIFEPASVSLSLVELNLNLNSKWFLILLRTGFIFLPPTACPLSLAILWLHLFCANILFTLEVGNAHLSGTVTLPLNN